MSQQIQSSFPVVSGASGKELATALPNAPSSATPFAAAMAETVKKYNILEGGVEAVSLDAEVLSSVATLVGGEGSGTSSATLALSDTGEPLPVETATGGVLPAMATAFLGFSDTKDSLILGNGAGLNMSDTSDISFANASLRLSDGQPGVAAGKLTDAVNVRLNATVQAQNLTSSAESAPGGLQHLSLSQHAVSAEKLSIVNQGDGGTQDSVLQSVRIDGQETLLKAQGSTLPSQLFRPALANAGAELAISSVGSVSPAVNNAASVVTPSGLAPITQHVQQPGFGDELANRVVWMVKQDVQAAEIKITPPQLGPIEVRVSVTNDQASVVLGANHTLTREALENSLPRLRDMLADAGLNLADANVSSQSSSQQDGRGRFAESTGHDEGAQASVNQENEDASELDSGGNAGETHSSRLLDLFA